MVLPNAMLHLASSTEPSLLAGSWQLEWTPISDPEYGDTVGRIEWSAAPRHHLAVLRMNVTTATVETLTAQVRVLMVGSRQITLSVAKQLDVAHVDDIAPMGRVRVTSPNDVRLIGSHLRTGVLVTAPMPWPDVPRVTQRLMNVRVCRECAPVSGSKEGHFGRLITIDGRDVMVSSWDTAGLEHEPGCCPRWGSPAGTQDWNVRQMTEVLDAYRADDDWNARVATARAMPLIVLAGLR